MDAANVNLAAKALLKAGSRAGIEGGNQGV